MRVSRPERLLPLACLAGALALFVSDFMTTFEVSVPFQGPQCTLTAPDRHHYSLAVLAVFAAGAVLAAIGWGSKPAAIGVAVAGGLSLILFLTVDLPDATASGALDAGCSSVTGSLVDADVVPQAGFWLELVGALALALTGLAMASLSSEQLAELAPRWLRRRVEPTADAAVFDTEAPPPNETPGPKDASSREPRPRKTSRSRTQAERRGERT